MEEELKILNQNGYKRYDPTNEGWYIIGYHYNKDKDRIECDFAEEGRE
jgi:hypothetical protein